MKRVIAMYLAALAVSVSAGTFETEDHFSLTLPDGWVRMPDDVLVSYMDSVASTNEAAEVYDYGFQMKSTGAWFSYPCVLVQVVQDLGRFSTGDLERFAGGEASLDDDRTLAMQVVEKNGVKILIGRQLTEYGFIQLSGFATEDAFAEYEGVFRDAFSNLSLDDLIRYKPQITDNAPVIGSINLGKVTLIFVQAALVGGGLWLIYSLVRRKLSRA